MASNTNEILWRFVADTKGLEKGSRTAQGEFKQVDNKSEKMRSGLGTATKALGALGLAFGAMEIKDYLTDAAALAKTAETVATSFDEVFGPSADRLRTDLDEARMAMGLGKDEMEAMLLTTGTLALGMGLPAEAAAEMSEELFVLAGDLQAFNPAAGTTEEALGALQAAIRGEFDPLERFGAKLSAAEVNARALAETGKASVEDLTAQEKAIATVGLAAEKTAVQQGALTEANEDGRRESEKLEARMRDLKVELGRELLPIMDDVTEALLNVTSGAEDAAEGVGGMLQPIEDATSLAADLTGGFEDADDAARFFGGAAGFVTDRIGDWIGATAPFTGAKGVWQRFSDNIRTATGYTDDYREAISSTFEPIDTLVRKAGGLTEKTKKTGEAFDGTARKIENMQDDIRGVRYDEAQEKLVLLKGYTERVDFAADQAARAFELMEGRARRAAGAAATAVGNVFAGRRAGGQGGFTAATGDVIVPGPRGAPMAATVHGGEQILTPAQQRDRGGGGGSVTINVVAGVSDPQAVADAVAEAIRLYTRTNGSIL